MSLIIFEDVEIEIVEDSKFIFTQTTNEVAKAYFGEPKTVQQAELFAKQIRQTRLNNKLEFIENKHFFYTYDNKNRKTIVWTKNGIIRLGFFIKSERAKKFRDWAEDYIVNKPTYNYQISGYKSQIAQHNNKIALLKNRVQALSSENEKLKIEKIRKEDTGNEVDTIEAQIYTKEDIVKLLTKGTKYDKLLNDYYNVYDKYDSISMTLRLAYPHIQSLMAQMERMQVHIPK